MMTDEINISSIETHFDSVIREHVSKSVYAGRLPSTLKSDVNEYVVIDCASAVNDLNAYGRATVNIYLYAQPISGQKNVAVMSKLEKAMRTALNNDLFDGEHYKVSRHQVYSNQDYDTSYNMDFTIMAIQLIII